MAYLYTELQQSKTTVKGEYNPADGDNIYLTIIKKWIGNLFEIIREEMTRLRDIYPLYPYYQLVDAKAKLSDFAASPDDCLLNLYNNGESTLHGSNYIYDFKIGTFVRVGADGGIINSNDTSGEYADIPLLSERFRISVDVKTTVTGSAEVVPNDNLSANTERTYTVTKQSFLAKQTIGKIVRVLTPKAICRGGKSMQSATGTFAFLITNNAFLLGGSASELPYTLFNFVIGHKIFSNEVAAFSNGLIRINGEVAEKIQHLPMKKRKSRTADKMTAHDLILRVDPDDYLIPNVYVTDEPIQTNYTEIQGQFLMLEDDTIVSPNPNVTEATDVSGSLCLLAALESFPTNRKILMLR